MVEVFLDQYSQSEFRTEGPFPSKQIERPFQSEPFYLSDISMMYAYIAYIIISLFSFGRDKKAHATSRSLAPDPKQPHDLANKTLLAHLWKMKQVPSWMEHLLLQGSVFGKVTVDFLIGTRTPGGVVLFGEEHAVSMHT